MKKKKERVITLPEPWERQPGESSEAFEAFKIYKDMGTNGEKRSIPKVSQKCTKNESLIKRWSSQYNWVKRVIAWDNEIERQVLEELVNGIAAMRKRHVSIAEAMLTKALKALKKIPEDELTPQDIIRMVDIASKLERLSRGEATERTEGKQMIAGEVSLNQMDLSSVSDEELNKLNEIISKLAAE